MSKVYHGSIEEVKKPEIRQSNRSLDYGIGFYTTTSYEQAKRLVERRMKDKGVSVGYVNIYELNDEVIKNMKSLFFDKPTEEWVSFVMKNRTEHCLPFNLLNQKKSGYECKNNARKPISAAAI